jgi:hypothetical protein
MTTRSASSVLLAATVIGCSSGGQSLVADSGRGAGVDSAVSPDAGLADHSATSGARGTGGTAGAGGARDGGVDVAAAGSGGGGASAGSGGSAVRDAGPDAAGGPDSATDARRDATSSARDIVSDDANTSFPGDTFLPWYGGPAYYKPWSNGLPSDPSFFMLTVWLQSPPNAKRYKAVGSTFSPACGKGRPRIS